MPPAGIAERLERICYSLDRSQFLGYVALSLIGHEYPSVGRPGSHDQT